MFNEQEENTFLAVVDIQLRDGNPPEAKRRIDSPLRSQAAIRRRSS